MGLSTAVLLAGPTLSVHNITMPAGRTFTQPLDGADPQGLPLTFSIVSISDSHVSGTLTTGNRSLRLNVAGLDGTGTPFTGDLTLELFENFTPRTTARIIQLANSGFYNGLTFHRVIQNFMAQGGDPLGNGLGGSGQRLDDEFVETLSFTGFGQLAIANSGHDTGDSQFFITDPGIVVGSATAPAPQWLDFNYTVFGQLTHGFDVMTKILSTSVNAANDLPLTPVIINRATVFTNTQAAVLQFQATAGFNGTATVVVQATSASGLFTQQTFTVTVVPVTVTDPPFIGPVPLSLNTTANTVVSFVLNYTDIDGLLNNNNVVQYLALVDPNTGLSPAALLGAQYDSTTSLLSFLAVSNFTGRVDMLLALTDSQYGFSTSGGFDTQLFSLTVLGSGCTYNLSQTNILVTASATTGTVAVTTGGGCGWTASSTQGFITIPSGTAGSGNGTVTYAVATNTTVAPRTGQLLIAGQLITVTQAGKPAPPVIVTDEVLPPGGAGVAYHAALIASGGTGSYTWSVVSNSLPAGLTLVAGSGSITGTPSSVMMTVFRVRVTDSVNAFTEANFNLTINPGPGATHIIGLTGDLAFGNVTTGSLATATLTINNLGNTNLTLSGISYPSRYSGAFSGTILPGSSTNVAVTFAPTSVGIYAGAVTVNSDATSGTNTIIASGMGVAPVAATAAITVLANPVSGGTVSGSGTYTVGTSQQITATPNTGWTFTGWNDSNNQNPRTIIVPDGGVTLTADFQQQAQSSVATPTITPAGGAVNDSVKVTLKCATAKAIIYYTIDGSDPTPASLRYKSAVTLTNSATLNAVAYSGTNGPSAMATASFIISRPAITTAMNLPAATAGMEYSTTLAAVGGTLPYKWKLLATKLPAGLKLSSAGVITGIPKTPGPWIFTVVLTDAKKGTAKQAFALTVN